MKKHFQKAILLLPMMLMLTSCDSNSISSSISETVANALPNLWITLAQLSAFLVMVFVFFKFAYKPIKQKLKDRQTYISNNISDSEAAKRSALQNQEATERNLANSRLQANEIIANANKEAQASAQSILDQAQEDADRIRKQGQADALEEKKRMERETNDAIVKNSIAISKEILGREINEKDNEKIATQFLDEMKKENQNEE